MIATFACLFVLSDKQIGSFSKGQNWHYVLTWHYTGKEIDTTDEESFDVEVAKVFTQSVTLKISQKLTATLFDDQRIPTDPKAVPATSEWALSPTGSVAFMPNARFGLETRFYRILKGILPAPKDDPIREEDWVTDYADDGQGMPKSRLRVWYVKGPEEKKEFGVGYLEKNGTKGVGEFVRAEKLPFPQMLHVAFTNTKMPGGTDVVDCDFKMRLKTNK